MYIDQGYNLVILLVSHISSYHLIISQRGVKLTNHTLCCASSRKQIEKWNIFGGFSWITVVVLCAIPSVCEVLLCCDQNEEYVQPLQ